MKFRFLKHPSTGIEDPMMTLSVIAALACVVKFLADGVTFTLYGHTMNLGHADSMAYGALLTPILGAHGYIQGLKPKGPDSNDNEK